MLSALGELSNCLYSSLLTWYCTPSSVWSAFYVLIFLFTFIFCSSGQKHKGSSGSQSKKAKKMWVEESEILCTSVILLYVLFIIICIILSYRINGKQSPSKPVKRASKNKLHQEDTKEASNISNPEETTTSKADEMYSGNIS